MIVGLTSRFAASAGRREAFIDGGKRGAVARSGAGDAGGFRRCESRRQVELADATVEFRVRSRRDRRRDADRGICLNVADPSEIERLDPASCDGIGLVRTEFLFSGAGELPGRRNPVSRLSAAGRMGGRQARHDSDPRRGRGQADCGADAGARDRTHSWGCVGIRLSLRTPESFRTQLGRYAGRRRWRGSK